MKKILSIEGMMCMHCVKSVENALKEKTKEVTVSLENKQAILIDSEFQDEELTAIINDLGFEVTGIRNE